MCILFLELGGVFRCFLGMAAHWSYSKVGESGDEMCSLVFNPDIQLYGILFSEQRQKPDSIFPVILG